MEILKASFIRLLFFTVPVLLPSMVLGQGNCLIYPEKSGERNACELSYQAIEYQQGSRASQMLFDEAIEVGPNYAWAYYQKSVPYFKRGLLHEGVTLINKAIALEPKEFYLTYRAYWFFTHESYAACAADLERYYFEQKGPLTFTPGGDLEMRFILALAYAKKSNWDKAIMAAKNCFTAYGDHSQLIGLFDYHVLGLLYYHNGQMEQAYESLNKQITLNSNLVDSYYYLGLVEKALSKNDSAKKRFETALDKLNQDSRRRFGYGFGVEKEHIENELNS